ncbi:MAG: phytase [Bacteroidia bacterium]|nr:phytase [Bacteroidia bacterium]
MYTNAKIFLIIPLAALWAGCQRNSGTVIKPALVTDRVAVDSDDPAIWYNSANPATSLVVGTDKGGDLGEGALYTFGLNGKIVSKSVTLKRPNNVDIAYSLPVDDKKIDVAVCTERLTNRIRVFSLPDLTPVDSAGIDVFEGEPDGFRDPMGIALYTDAATNQLYAIVGRKNGPTDGTYLWQYKLQADSLGVVRGTVVRKFGYYSGKKEIESIAVDNELGYVYHSDEMHGIHKSYAHPDSSNVELALFGSTGFTEDVEGISIYKLTDTTGYILVSDQQANLFRVFPREGTKGNPHLQEEIVALPLSTLESDGSDVTSVALPGFQHGLFVAMSTNGTFQLYRWEDLAGDVLKKK